MDHNRKWFLLCTIQFRVSLDRSGNALSGVYCWLSHMARNCVDVSLDIIPAHGSPYDSLGKKDSADSQKGTTQFLEPRLVPLIRLHLRYLQSVFEHSLNM